MMKSQRSDSPSQPGGDAIEPIETAHIENSTLSVDTKMADVKAEMEKKNGISQHLMMEGEPKSETDVKMNCEGSKSCETTVGACGDGILTSAMIEEEKQLHEETVKEEEKIIEKRQKMLKEMTDDLKEERYKKLQYLLSKSNLYTQYLIDRMQRQKDEEAKRRERQMKRRATQLKKETEKKKQETQLQTGEISESTGSYIKSEEGRRSKRKEAESDSQGTDDKPDSQDSASSKRGRKRKVENTSPQVSSQVSKKGKVEEKDEEKEPVEEVADPAKQEEVEETAGEVDANSSLTEMEEQVTPAKQRMFNGKPVHAEQPVMFTGGILRAYQIEGFKWLRMLYENGVNGILADEMGLGKTIQCIALLSHLVNMGVVGPYLVIGPLSTLPNWHSEFIRFSPKVPVILYHGSKEDRTNLRRKIKRTVPIKKNVDSQPVVITSYEIAMNDRKFLQNYEWKYLIVDEGHRIKNAQCRLIHELRMYRSTHRLLLTGTPLQNNLAELWSLLNFLLPEIFDDLGSFEAWFDVEYMSEEGSEERIAADEQKQNVLSMLHQILTPFLLRRLKTDVDLCIPPKREVLVYAPLTTIQEEYYKAIVNRTVLQMIEKKKEGDAVVEVNEKGRPVRRATKKVVNYEVLLKDYDENDDQPKKGKRKDEEEDDDLDEWIKAVMESQNNKVVEEKKESLYSSQVTIKMANIMMQLRKCCNHPYLLEYPLDDKGEYQLDDNVIKTSGKMLLLDRMLQELKRKGHKVLLFSQMTKMLDIVEDYCYLKKMKYCRLDGSCKVEDRREQMDTFNKNPEMFLFLLSTRAGGLGINLVSADTVIIYDSDWNPQSDLQAQDRCHRIGQTRPVVVYRLVTANTIDQRIVERASAKRKLEKMIIHKGKFKSGMDNFSTSLVPIRPEELLALLKASDHQGIIQGKEGDVISDSDLNHLLDRADLNLIWQKQLEQHAEQESGKSSLITKTENKSKSPTSICTKEEVKGVFRVLETEEGRTGAKMGPQTASHKDDIEPAVEAETAEDS